jgi:hypothetical protein
LKHEERNLRTNSIGDGEREVMGELRKGERAQFLACFPYFEKIN